MSAAQKEVELLRSQKKHFVYPVAADKSIMGGDVDFIQHEKPVSQ